MIRQIWLFAFICLPHTSAYPDIPYSPRYLEDSNSTDTTSHTSIYSCAWELNSTSSKYFDSNSGICMFQFKELEDSKIFKLLIFDGNWKSRPVYSISSELSGTTTNDTIIIENSGVLYDDIHMKKYTCDFKGSITLNSSHFTGKLYSKECEINLSFSGNSFTLQDTKEPIVTYSFLYSCLAVCTLFGYIRHINDCIQSESHAKKSSLATWVMNACIDCSMCIWHMSQAFKSIETFDYFILVACWSLGCFMMVNGKLLLKIWRSQTPELDSMGIIAFRRTVTLFQNKITFVVLSVMICLIAFEFLYLFVIFLLHSFFVPQIIRNIREGSKHAISRRVIYFLTLSRSILIVYMFGYPDNFLECEPNYSYAACLVGFLCLQVAILLLQSSRLGPRFFIPRSLRPSNYSYYRNLEEERDQEEIDCAICMNALNLQGKELGEVLDQARTLHTPCNHQFHEDCLLHWMDVKMECPTCRSVLPIFEEF